MTRLATGLIASISVSGWGESGLFRGLAYGFPPVCAN
jgi:hypothetical protein